jgi:HlyD family secretion protein
MKRPSKKVLIIVAVVILIAITVTSVMGSKKREKPTYVTTEKAVRKTITQLVTATGKIQPEIEVKIAPEVSGEIVLMPVKEGQIVRRGDLLLKIKPDAIEAQVESQVAALNSARASSARGRAEVEKAETEYNRAKSLFDRGLLSAADWKNAQTQFDVTKAALSSAQFDAQRAEGALRQIRDALSKTAIYSPTEGTISSLTSRLGERVVGTSQFAGTEVMRIANLNNMEARVNVNENDIVNVKIGDQARINIDAYPDQPVRGIVREIASTAATRNQGSQEEVTNFEVKISIPNPMVTLRPGMSATADIETSTVASAVAIPIQAVTVREADSKLSPEEAEKQRKKATAQEGNPADVTNEAMEKQKARELREKLQRVVFIKNGDTVKMQKVETGIADSTSIEIKSGVKPGDEVVSGSYTVISRKLKDGMKVAIEKPASDDKKKG